MPEGSASLEGVRRLRGDGRHEEARELAASLAKAAPRDAEVLFEAASVCDYLDREAEAAGYYIAAIEAGVAGDNLRAAYLGLGSTYRLLGRYDESLAALEEGLRRFPGAREFCVFSALTCHKMGRFDEAVGILLRVIADTSSDAHIQDYERAIRHYAESIGSRE
jgi:tetratricopeptide (TPR) repeat protein